VNWKTLGALLAGLAVGAGVFYWQDRKAYPVLSVACWKESGECTTIAKFTEWQGCQYASDLGNMGCDRSNPDKVVCTHLPNPTVVGQCVNR
jgi:hypothetical protein